MAKPNNIAGQRHQPPPPELIEKFLALQGQELELRTKELTISAQQEDNHKAIAEASITANLQDRENERAHRERRTKLIFIGCTVILVLVLSFLGFALYTGKDAVAFKVIEILGTFAAGFIGGYGLKAARKKEGEK